MILNYPDISLFSLVRDTAKKHAKYPAFNYFGHKISRREFLSDIDRCAAALAANGVCRGDVVSVCMPNTPEAVVLFYAINKLGAVAAMIHPLSAESEIERYLNETNSRLLFAIDMAWSRVSAVLPKTGVVKTVLLSVDLSMPPSYKVAYRLKMLPKHKTRVKRGDITDWKHFMLSGKGHSADAASTTGDDPAAILFTGGTTDLPKGIVLSNLNFNAVAMQGFAACGTIAAGDSMLSIMPIFHGFGLGICIHTVLYFGGTAIVLPQFSANSMHKLLLKYKPNILGGVPTIYEALIKNPNLEGVDLSFLHCIISGGDSLSVGLKKKLDAFFESHNCHVSVREGYGLTECVTGSCLMPAGEYRENSIGKAYPDMTYKIVQPQTTTELPFGQEGEIALNGPSVMLGYLNDEEATAKTLICHEDGKIWLHTGDLGSMDADGFIYFKQRIKRMIISSGYNIYPQQIENAIDSHPNVLMSAVIGIPHHYKKEIPKAFIVLKDGTEPSDELKEEIAALCAKSVARYAIPAQYKFVASLPKTLVGKIDYRKLAGENSHE